MAPVSAKIVVAVSLPEESTIDTIYLLPAVKGSGLVRGIEKKPVAISPASIVYDAVVPSSAGLGNELS